MGLPNAYPDNPHTLGLGSAKPLPFNPKEVHNGITV